MCRLLSLKKADEIFIEGVNREGLEKLFGRKCIHCFTEKLDANENFV